MSFSKMMAAISMLFVMYLLYIGDKTSAILFGIFSQIWLTIFLAGMIVEKIKDIKKEMLDEIKNFKGDIK